MYKEDKIGTYLITTHLRKNSRYIITTLSKNHVIEITQTYFYMYKILKQIDMGNFMPLDRVKMYTKNYQKI